MMYCLIFSHEIFYVTIVLCLNILWLKATNEITAMQTQTSLYKLPHIWCLCGQHIFIKCHIKLTCLDSRYCMVQGSSVVVWQTLRLHWVLLGELIARQNLQCNSDNVPTARTLPLRDSKVTGRPVGCSSCHKPWTPISHLWTSRSARSIKYKSEVQLFLSKIFLYTQW